MKPIIYRIREAFIIFIIALIAGGGANAAPLFENDSVLQIRIEAPIKDLAKRASKETPAYAGRLIVNGDAASAYDIELSARGNSRRDPKVCSFPPLRVKFNEKPKDGLVFDGQKSLKLVTHCKASSGYQQYYLMEYAAYRLLNVLTPSSLRVRLADVEYYDNERDETVIRRTGFFIEDTDDAAERNGVEEIDTPDIDIAQVDPAAAGLVAVFQYMIGNLDWSVHDGPDGEDCCHNMKLIGEDSEPYDDLVPIPYDFDYSGLVDAPYAAPPDSVKVRNVRTRRYRGYCLHNEMARQAMGDVLAKKDDLLGVFDEIDALDDSKRRKARRFLDGFFLIISNDEKIEKQMFKYCRG